MNRLSILKDLPPFGILWVGIIIIAIGLFSCNREQPKTVIKNEVRQDTIQKEFMFIEKKDSLIQSGEYIKHFKNGGIEIRGFMKDGKREGEWKSFYEDGSPWSETTYIDGKKNGKTSAWYPNKKKRYEGFYSKDKESGKWMFWDENGKIQNTKNY